MLLAPKTAYKFSWAHKHIHRVIYKLNQLAQLLNANQEASQLQLAELYTVLCIVKHLLLSHPKGTKSQLFVNFKQIAYPLLDNKENLAINTYQLHSKDESASAFNEKLML